MKVHLLPIPGKWLILRYSIAMFIYQLIISIEQKWKCCWGSLKLKARRLIFHVPNPKWMNSNKEIGSLTLGSADEKFDVWPRPKVEGKFLIKSNVWIWKGSYYTRTAEKKWDSHIDMIILFLRLNLNNLKMKWRTVMLILRPWKRDCWSWTS